MKKQNPKTFQTTYKLGIKWEKEKMPIQKKKVKKKVKKKKQVPRARISILTGTAFAVQCSTHWAAGNLPWKESKV